jgi:hypothetical protein
MKKTIVTRGSLSRRMFVAAVAAARGAGAAQAPGVSPTHRSNFGQCPDDQPLRDSQAFVVADETGDSKYPVIYPPDASAVPRGATAPFLVIRTI